MKPKTKSTVYKKKSNEIKNNIITETGNNEVEFRFEDFAKRYDFTTIRVLENKIR